MTVEIRRASLLDEAAVCRLNDVVQSLHATAMPWRFKSVDVPSVTSATVRGLLTDPDATVLLASREGEACGYASVTINERAETEYSKAYTSVYLHHLSVAPDQRRTGVGEALLVAVQAFAAERGIPRIELDVWTFNDAARTFFRKQGFTVCNERMWKA